MNKKKERMSEYSGATTNSSGCAYATLKRYNMAVQGTTPPVPATTVRGHYIVPAWNYRPAYDTLVKGGCCAGYPSIGQAYGKDAGQCNPKYVKMPCGM